MEEKVKQVNGGEGGEQVKDGGGGKAGGGRVEAGEDGVQKQNGGGVEAGGIRGRKRSLARLCACYVVWHLAVPASN